MELYGRNWTRRELEARVGRIEQIGGVRRIRLIEGSDAGVEHVQVRTGAGLSYFVSPSRGLDISLAEFGSVPISWQSPNSDVHPSFYDSQAAEFLRTAVGGLLMTCGLTYVGAPGVDQGQPFGLHGRVHHTPARQLSVRGQWIDDEYQMHVSGVVEETKIFGEYVRLTRTIRSTLGQNVIAIEDAIENVGFETTPHMILYHFNFGFPLLTEDTLIHFPSGNVEPRDDGTPVDGFDRWQAPDAGYQERVYYHQELGDEEACVTVENPNFPFAGEPGTQHLKVQLKWSLLELPRLVQWKMSGAGTHVLGIEPANCYVEGRGAERSRGTLQCLEPGESRSYHIKLEVHVGG